MADYLNVVPKGSSDASYSLAPLTSLTNSSLNETSVTGFNDVIFIGVSEFHAADTDLVCKFSIRLPTEQVHPSDIIGLYRVGWTSIHEHACSQPISASLGVSSSSRAGYELVNSVIFKAKDLPKDDGEFYQFCYISHSNIDNKMTNGSSDPSTTSSNASINQCASNSTHWGQVKGASIPFQFIEDDFEILDQPSLISLVTKSPTELMAKYGYTDHERNTELTKSASSHAEESQILETDGQENKSTSFRTEGCQIVEMNDNLIKDTTSINEAGQTTETSTSNLLIKSTSSTTGFDQAVECSCSNTVMGQSTEMFYDTMEQSVENTESQSGVEQDTTTATRLDGNSLLSGSDIKSENHMQSKENEKLLEMMERLRISELDKEALELRLRSMEEKLTDQEKTILDLTRSLDDRNSEKIAGQLYCQELEAAHDALSMVKDNLAERVAKQDKERTKLMKQIKQTTDELDQLKVAFSEYKKASTAKDSVINQAQELNFASAQPCFEAPQANNEGVLMYPNPYEDYKPGMGMAGHMSHMFDQFSS